MAHITDERPYGDDGGDAGGDGGAFLPLGCIICGAPVGADLDG